jgi:hypothetical protein
MPKLAIDKGLLADLVKLEKPVAKRVTEVFDEFDTATHAGPHFEKINKACGSSSTATPVAPQLQRPVCGGDHVIRSVVGRRQLAGVGARRVHQTAPALGGLQQQRGHGSAVSLPSGSR